MILLFDEKHDEHDVLEHINIRTIVADPTALNYPVRGIAVETNDERFFAFTDRLLLHATIQTREVISRLPIPQITCIDVHQNMIGIGTMNGQLKILDITAGNRELLTQEFHQPIRKIKFINDHQFLFACHGGLSTMWKMDINERSVESQPEWTLQRVCTGIGIIQEGWLATDLVGHMISIRHNNFVNVCLAFYLVIFMYVFSHDFYILF